jgi:kumamolisin
MVPMPVSYPGRLWDTRIEMADDRRVPLPGSERAPRAGARVAGPVDPGERVEVTVLVRPREPLPEPTGGAPLTREELAARHGADPADIERVERFAAEQGLEVLERSPARRSVALAGSAEQVQRAFGVELARWQDGAGAYRGRTGPVRVPADLAGVVEAVLGLDDRAQARAQFRIAPRAARSFTPTELARLYDFPAGADGSGQAIAIIELGGGFRTEDLSAYFAGLGIPAPEVTAVSVDGAANAPSTPDGADAEVMLDIEVAGAIAPGAHLIVLFAPNTDRGFLDAITTATHDSRRPSVISISWGSPESAWTAQALRSFDDAFAAAAAVGVTVCCASGDSGSGDGVGDGRAHADFPAASPHVLACGGTTLEESGGRIGSERVWNHDGGATGGGVSDAFALPSWQTGAGVPPSANPGGRAGRGIPDVAGDADPATGYRVRVDGQELVIGGTSAVSPLWAGLVALVNQGRGSPLGLANPALYAAAAAFRDITQGDNGAYRAGTGWDPCTGLGSPDGARLAATLAAPSA